MAKDDPDSYYYQFTQIPRQKAIDMAKDVWNEINYPNLQDYIEPTRNRANIILHKSTEHKIDTVFLRKY
jgi:type I pantothenate kinase